MKYYIGLDIGGTKCGICLGLCGEGRPEIVDKQVFQTAGTTYSEVLEKYSAIITEYLKKYKVAAIGIACGSPLDSEAGIIQSPPNLPGWNDVHIVDYFKKKFGLPAYLENDANACALAEWKYGAGQGTNNFIFMTFGTGLGAGLVLDGKLYRGTNGNAGEVGHIRLEKDGPVGYNKAGSAEGFCSGNGIKKLAAIRAREKGVEWNGETSAREIFARANDGDAFCKEIVRETAERFAGVVSLLVDLFNPEIIVAGGVFMRNYETFMTYMQPVLERECLPFSLDVCKILPAKLTENVGDYSALAIAQWRSGDR